jgi:hypothetical protein
MPALHEKLPVISKPLQILAEAGDVLVVHSSLPHSVAPNVSSSIDTRCTSGSTAQTGGSNSILAASRVAFECLWVVRVLQGHERHRR